MAFTECPKNFWTHESTFQIHLRSKNLTVWLNGGAHDAIKTSHISKKKCKMMLVPRDSARCARHRRGGGQGVVLEEAEDHDDVPAKVDVADEDDQAT